MVGVKIIENRQMLTALRKAAGSLTPDELARVAGRAAATATRDHLFERDRSHPNKMGGSRTHFYADAARSVQAPNVGGGRAEISVMAVGLAQRWLGGTITAGAGTSSKSGGPTRFLAVPARAEAYGKTPGEFHDLQFVPASSEHPAMLVQALQTLLKRGKRGFKGARVEGGFAMFWLFRSVTQRADPEVMPSDDELGKAAGTAVNSYVARRLQTTS